MDEPKKPDHVKTRTLAQGRKIRRPLTNKQKAEVLLRKEIRGPGNSNLEIAKTVGCAETTVDHVNYKTLPPEAKKIYDRKKETLKYKALDATEAALEKGIELMSIADSPKALAGIAAMGKFADTVYRLETQQPTEIVKTLPAERHALDFIKMLMEKLTRSEALDAFREADLDPLIPAWRRDDIHSRIVSGELKLLGE